MSKKINGPAIFLAQFLKDEEPFNNLMNIGKWAAELGYIGVQLPAWDERVIDLAKAAESKTYCDDLKGKLKGLGLEVTELATHLQGQMMAVHPAYNTAFAGFRPKTVKTPNEAKEWATEQLRMAILASEKLGLNSIPTFSGAFLWHMAYPWPQRPPGIVDQAFDELAKRWRPVFNLAKDHGQAMSFELHPGEDLHDGVTFEVMLNKVNGHPACCLIYDPSHFVLQQLDYLAFIQLYGERIRSFHVKDAEFRPSGRVGVYGGYQSWAKRAGRFRSLGDGQVDFTCVFTLLTEAGYTGWAVLEWECCVKSPEQGAREGAPFIARHIIEATEVAFDDFAGGEADVETNKKILGLS